MFNLQNLTNDCNTKIGGIDFVILFDGNDISNHHIYNSSGQQLSVNDGPQNYILGNFSTTMFTTNKAVVYNVQVNGNSFSTKTNIEPETGQNYITSSFSCKFNGLTEKLAELYRLCRKNHRDNIQAFVHTNAGEWFLLGYYNGLSISNIDGNFGSNIGDGETMTISFEDIGPYAPLYCTPSYSTPTIHLVSDLNEIYNTYK